MSIINRLGIDEIKPYIPFDMKTLMHHYQNGDMNFDKTNIIIWENASGYYTTEHTENCMFDCNISGYGLEYLLRHNGIKYISASQRIDILKETARILCEREMNKQ